MTIREMMAMYHSLQFVEELLDYIEQYPDDDYMTMECLCRKLVKYKLMKKIDGYYIADRKTEPQTEVRYSDSTDYQSAVDYVTDTDCSWK